MLAHILITVSNFPKSEAFYTKVLATLGLKKNIGEEGIWCGFGEKDEPLFEINSADENYPAHRNIHVAFVAKSKEQVEEFYKIAIENGAVDNGKPGYRKEYTDNYYACFVKDFDENNIEAVYME